MVIFGVSLAGVGLTLALVVALVRVEGLERASWWASVLSLVLAAVGVVVSVVAWRRPVGPGAGGHAEGLPGDRPGVSVGNVEVSGPGSVGVAINSPVITGNDNVVGESDGGRR